MVKLANSLAILGLTALLGVTVLTIFDIFLRSSLVYALRDAFPALDTFLYDSGLSGISDIYGPLGIVAVAACFPAMVASRSAITVRFLINGFSWRLREIIGFFSDVALLIMFGLMAYWVGDYTQDLWETGETTWLIQMPRWPAWLIATSCLVFAAGIQAVLALEQGQRVLSKTEPEQVVEDFGGLE